MIDGCKPLITKQSEQPRFSLCVALRHPGKIQDGLIQTFPAAQGCAAVIDGCKPLIAKQSEQPRFSLCVV